MIRFYVATVFIFVMLIATLGAQGSPYLPPPNLFFVRHFELNKTELDAEKKAVVYYTAGKPEQMNKEAHDYVFERLSYEEISYHELDDLQYEVCCATLQLFPRTNQPMFVLYFNGAAKQLPFDKDTDVDLSLILQNIGWRPLRERLEEFLIQNPHNQEAMSVLFASTLQNISDQTMSLDVQDKTTTKTLDGKALPSFVRALRLIVDAKALDWMTHGATSAHSLYNLGRLRNSPILANSSEFQSVVIDLVRLIEEAIEQRPTSTLFRYLYWSAFNSLKRKPAPFMQLLHKLDFPSNTDSFVPITSFLSILRMDGLHTGTEANKQLIEEAFKLHANVAEWMLEKDPHLDSVFRSTYGDFALSRARLMIQFKRYTELESHLRTTRDIIGAGWGQFAKDLNSHSNIKNQQVSDLPELYRTQVATILELPAIVKNIKPFNGISVSHNLDEEALNKLRNFLQQQKVRHSLTRSELLPFNSWSLYNIDVLVASGMVTVGNESNDNAGMSELLDLIRKSDSDNFRILKQFIRLNPDHFDAIDIYIANATKFLPDEELEKELLGYCWQTRTAPSLEAYSKMEKKDEWSQLISKIIGEELLKLSDVPISALRNPWLNLSQWEDLDSQKNSIDWYSLLKESVFWYAPEYYFSALEAPMPTAVLIKYLNMAEAAKDWDAVLTACRTRFRWEKKNCRNEKILGVWEKAENFLKTPKSPTTTIEQQQYLSPVSSGLDRLAL